jgi:type II secretory pathway component GspD/PulD (secretin)
MKEFEDKFGKLQADMVSICMEFVEDRADRVYIYASCEEGVISSSFFYCINNIYVEAHKVNDALKDEDQTIDVSPKRGLMVLDIINGDIRKIRELCKEYERDMPTEMKLIYEVKSGKFQAQYQYDLVHSNDDVKIPDDFAYEWFEEIKNNSL